MTVQPDWQRNKKFTIKVRIPAGARNEPVPGGLYKFCDALNEPVALTVNGEDVPVRLDKGYVSLDRSWKSGDVIELDLPMLIRRVAASENVPADRGRVALQRGPIVFCVEWPDTPKGQVHKLLLPDEQPVTTRFDPALLNGVQVIEGKGYNVATNEFGKNLQTPAGLQSHPVLRLGQPRAGEMIVWIAKSEKSVNAP